MIDSKLLKVIESAYNSVPCKHCGRQHRVCIDQVPTHQKTLCDQADITIPRGDTTITINLDDDACLSAQNEIILLVSRKTAKYFPL